MTSDGRGGGGGSAKSDFISKGPLIKRLMRGGGGSKNGKYHLTSYMDGPLPLLASSIPNFSVLSRKLFKTFLNANDFCIQNSLKCQLLLPILLNDKKVLGKYVLKYLEKGQL